jgi:hypothetical protein
VTSKLKDRPPRPKTQVRPPDGTCWAPGCKRPARWQPRLFFWPASAKGAPDKFLAPYMSLQTEAQFCDKHKTSMTAKLMKDTGREIRGQMELKGCVLPDLSLSEARWTEPMTPHQLQMTGPVKYTWPEEEKQC